MDLDSLLNSMIKGADVIRLLVVSLACYAVGWFVLLQGGLRLVNWTTSDVRYSGWSISIRFVVGTLFVHFNEYINMQVLTWTGQLPEFSSAMNVMPGSGGTVMHKIAFTVCAWLGTIGVMAIFRGTRMLLKAFDGNGQASSMHEDPGWTAAVFIVSGSIGINLWRFMSPYL